MPSEDRLRKKFSQGNKPAGKGEDDNLDLAELEIPDSTTLEEAVDELLDDVDSFLDRMTLQDRRNRGCGCGF